jgi:AAA family ATP:ADP antiporter
MTSNSGFSSKWRQIFWPIHKQELVKFVPMAMWMFCVLFSQNMLRILKDSIIISEIGVEITNFVKMYCVTPAAALFVIIYTKMVNYYSFKTIHNFLLIIFVSFFVMFGFIIYPNTDFFHMDHNNVESLMLAHPHLKWFIALVGHWSYVMFYVLAELWPNIFYVLLFWQFANDTTTTEEAGRFYTLFSLFGNSSLIIVGLLMMNISSETFFVHKYFDNSDIDVTLVQMTILVVLFSSVISIVLINFLSRRLYTDPSLYAKAKSDKTFRPKLGLKESFRYILNSRYLWLLLICSAAFGLSMNLVEAVFKSKMKELYTNINDFASFSGFYTLWTGIAIMIMTIIGNNIMRSYGWFVTAVITPIIILTTGVTFFVMVLFDQDIMLFFGNAILIMSPLAMAVAVGAVQNILSKGAKYSIWDTSREMLYIPLDGELRTKGKAAVDLVSSKIGKASSGLIQSVLFILVPTITYNSMSPFLMVIFVIICVLWIYSVKQIYNEYRKLV